MRFSYANRLYAHNSDPASRFDQDCPCVLESFPNQLLVPVYQIDCT